MDTQDTASYEVHVTDAEWLALDSVSYSDLIDDMIYIEIYEIMAERKLDFS